MMCPLRVVQKQTGNGLLRELERVKQESEDVDIGGGMTVQSRFSSAPASWFFWMYKRWLCWHMSVDDTIKALEARDVKLSQEITKLSELPDQTTGNAIIVFNWVHNAANMLYDHNLRNRCSLQHSRTRLECRRFYLVVPSYFCVMRGVPLQRKPARLCFSSWA